MSSIVIPTFNRPDLLTRALRSVVNQTSSDWECIVVDDASASSAADVVRRIGDPRMTVLRHATNRGVSATINTGIQASRGQLISLLNDDDEYAPRFVERTQALFDEAPPDVGFAWTGARRRSWSGRDEERIWPAQVQPREAALIAATTIGGGYGLTLRRETIEHVGTFDETKPVAEDTRYFFRLVQQVDFRTVPEVLVVIHEDSPNRLTSPTVDADRFDAYAEILGDNAAFIAAYPALFDIHHRRLAQLAYSTGRKEEGRRIMRALWRNGQNREVSLRDLACFEATGMDAPTLWRRNPHLRRALGPVRRALRGSPSP
jgi:glycosyltransferase involved in cell wall biosynthesis